MTAYLSGYKMANPKQWGRGEDKPMVPRCVLQHLSGASTLSLRTGKGQNTPSEKKACAMFTTSQLLEARVLMTEGQAFIVTSLVLLYHGI